MLAVDALAFGFPGKAIGRDVGFQLGTGEVMCVLGPNGGGKTTLFRTLLGLLAPLGGSIALDGMPLGRLSRAEIARRVGYVPQTHAGYFAYTVEELVLMGRASRLGALESPGRLDRAVAARALEALGLASIAHRPVTEISGGERQLALIARALAQEARLLVMDEPTAGLDFGNQVRVLERLHALATQGLSVLFSSHDPDHAFRYAQRAMLLAGGQAIETGPPVDVIRADTLERLYGVPVRVIALEGGGHTCLPSPKR